MILTSTNTGCSTQDVFTEYFTVFSRRHVFTPLMAPFADRSHEPYWFKREFPALNAEYQTKVFEIWSSFLTPKLLSTRLRTTKDNLGIIGYQPNLVAQQFGFIQSLPNSIFSRKKDLCHNIVEITEEEYSMRLTRQSGVLITHTPFPFETSFYCTQEFDNWWKDYHTNNFVDVLTMMHSLP